MTKIYQDSQTKDVFYVAALRGGRIAFLAGPFDTLGKAQTYLNRARALAVAYDARAWFYAFGCYKAKAHPILTKQPGKFNRELGL